MRNLIIGIAIGLSLVVGVVSAQDNETGDDISNLAYIELGSAAFNLDAQGEEIGCSVELIP